MKLLLLSDNTMNVDDKGFSQTLCNVFGYIPPPDILCITSARAFKKIPPTGLLAKRYLTYNFSFFRLPLNRVTARFKKWETWLNFSLNQQFRSFSYLHKAIREFDPDIAVIAPNGAESMLIYDKLRPAFVGKTVFPYFMDDWAPHQQKAWLGGNINSIVKKLLSQHTRWLMISRQLAEILSGRYGIEPGAVLELHNPVMITHTPIVPVLENKDSYTIAYAGSLWPMHFDALELVCKAVSLVEPGINIRLIIYTSQEHWNWRRPALDFSFVEYGGNIAYEQIHAKLEAADALLVTASFSKKWYTHTKASVQTKLTDYMKAARLIISCGPVYAANNLFCKRYNCGICMETDDPQHIAGQLSNTFEDMPGQQHYIENGINALMSNFTFEKVHQKLSSFIGFTA